ncbi:MAG: hypothetical protein RLZZ628_1097, partial [Bacteroidota bacterium]
FWIGRPVIRAVFGMDRFDIETLISQILILCRANWNTDDADFTDLHGFFLNLCRILSVGSKKSVQIRKICVICVPIRIVILFTPYKAQTYKYFSPFRIVRYSINNQNALAKPAQRTHCCAPSFQNAKPNPTLVIHNNAKINCCKP